MDRVMCFGVSIPRAIDSIRSWLWCFSWFIPFRRTNWFIIQSDAFDLVDICKVNVPKYLDQFPLEWTQEYISQFGED